jgi:lipopolysaccharide export system permease protein
MKKIDRLILQAFVGPFILTLAVVVFILLIQQIMQYIDELLGKGLGYDVFAELLFYFSVHLVPLALPLAILLSSLITFGNLGEHFELTAMKSSGISLIRVLMPIFLFAIFIAFFSFWFNDQVVPQANLKAYSLLWDIRQKSPSLSLKEGAFYNGLPGYSIKVSKKFPDGKSIKDVMIYDHTDARGNRVLILSDSGRMYTIMNERYLVLELFKGKSYHDQVAGTNPSDYSNEKFIYNTFSKSQIVFSLASFDMKQTDESLFKGHRVMHTFWELFKDIDSLKKQTEKNQQYGSESFKSNFQYQFKKIMVNQPINKIAKVEEPSKKIDSVANSSTVPNSIKVKFNKPPVKNEIKEKIAWKSMLKKVEQPKQDTVKVQRTRIQPSEEQIYTYALTQVRNVESTIKSRKDQKEAMLKEFNQFRIEWYKKITLAFACITMFLIGAPLGAIIKKGGLGVPVLVAIIFFIAFYVIMITGEKWVKENFLVAPFGMWLPNMIMLSFGFFFLRQARNDSRLFEADFYYVLRDRFISRYKKKS